MRHLAAEGGADRRRAVRRQPAVGTFFRFDEPNDTDRMGLVWNISETGISMLLPESFERGVKLNGRLVSNDRSQSLPVTFQVVHVRRIESGDHFVGGQFEKRLTPDEMKPFLFD